MERLQRVCSSFTTASGSLDWGHVTDLLSRHLYMRAIQKPVVQRLIICPLGGAPHLPCVQQFRQTITGSFSIFLQVGY